VRKQRLHPQEMRRLSGGPSVMPTLTGCTVVCRRQPDRRRLRLGEVPISRNKTSGHTTWLDVERPQLPVGLPETKPLDRASARVGIDTVDSFFDSLAADFGCRTVAVVLSGTGADGAAGAVRVKQGRRNGAGAGPGHRHARRHAEGGDRRRGRPTGSCRSAPWRRSWSPAPRPTTCAPRARYAESPGCCRSAFRRMTAVHIFTSSNSAPSKLERTCKHPLPPSPSCCGAKLLTYCTGLICVGAKTDGQYSYVLA
jgi:CheB methylesterase